MAELSKYIKKGLTSNIEYLEFNLRSKEAKVYLAIGGNPAQIIKYTI